MYSAATRMSANTAMCSSTTIRSWSRTSSVCDRELAVKITLAALVSTLAIGCGGESRSDAPEAERCPIGDMAAPAELVIVHLDARNAVVNTQPMQTVPLLAPPQGGWIVLLGARARNIDGC